MNEQDIGQAVVSDLPTDVFAEIDRLVAAGYRVSVRDAAELFGYKVYDSAVPQPWADAVLKLTGIYPPGLVVWCYDKARTFGAPVPVSREGEALLDQLAGQQPLLRQVMQDAA
ncbi:MAG: hypothetical protein ACYDAG_02495 [Chloroflexota bacterium]